MLSTHHFKTGMSTTTKNENDEEEEEEERIQSIIY